MEKSSKSSSSAKTVNKSTKTTPTPTTSKKPDYKSKFRPIKPPPADGGRPPKNKEKVRPDVRPSKDKKPRPDPPPSDWVRPIESPYPRPPVWIPDDPPYERGYEIVYVEDYYPALQDEETPKNLDFTSMLLTSVTIVWNAVYIKAGQPNEFVATAGLFTGVSSLALAFSGKSNHTELSVLFGVASIAFSVLNLSGGMDPPDQSEYRYYNDDPYYNSQPTFANQVGYSYSF